MGAAPCDSRPAFSDAPETGSGARTCSTSRSQLRAIALTPPPPAGRQIAPPTRPPSAPPLPAYYPVGSAPVAPTPDLALCLPSSDVPGPHELETGGRAFNILSIKISLPAAGE